MAVLFLFWLDQTGVNFDCDLLDILLRCLRLHLMYWSGIFPFWLFVVFKTLEEVLFEIGVTTEHFQGDKIIARNCQLRRRGIKGLFGELGDVGNYGLVKNVVEN